MFSDAVKFDSTFKLSDLTTALSLCLSAIALMYTWSKDVSLKEREQANQIRKASSETLSKLERRKELSLWFFEEIQPLIVEASEHLARDKDVYSTRDLIWKGANSLRFKSRQRIVEENIEAAYTNLFPYYPNLRELFKETEMKLQTLDGKTHDALMADMENEILGSKIDSVGTTAILGNTLRRAAAGQRAKYAAELQQTIAVPEAVLFGLVTRTDEALISGK